MIYNKNIHLHCNLSTFSLTFIKRKKCKWADCLDSNLKCSFLLSSDIKQDCDPKLPCSCWHTVTFSKTIKVNLQAIGERL